MIHVEVSKFFNKGTEEVVKCRLYGGKRSLLELLLEVSIIRNVFNN